MSSSLRMRRNDHGSFALNITGSVQFPWRSFTREGKILGDVSDQFCSGQGWSEFAIVPTVQLDH